MPEIAKPHREGGQPKVHPETMRPAQTARQKGTKTGDEKRIQEGRHVMFEAMSLAIERRRSSGCAI